LALELPFGELNFPLLFAFGQTVGFNLLVYQALGRVKSLFQCFFGGEGGGIGVFEQARLFAGNDECALMHGGNILLTLVLCFKRTGDGVLGKSVIVKPQHGGKNQHGNCEEREANVLEGRLFGGGGRHLYGLEIFVEKRGMSLANKLDR